MPSLPLFLAARYRFAITHEIRSWSFGVVHARRRPEATHWQEQVGTLDDQRIFGPMIEFACACGKYQGQKCSGMICDRCGVKITSPSVRRERFGHVELGTELQHPVGAETDRISVFPILPAFYIASHGGAQLAERYEALAEAASAGKVDQSAVDRVAELLLPVIILAHEWRLTEAQLLARGLGLLLREGPD